MNRCQALFPKTTAWIVAGDRCAHLPAEEVMTRMAYANSVFQIYAEMPGVLYIDSTDFMCSDNYCLSNVPETNELMFRDDNHLNSTGSAYYMNALVKRTTLLDFISKVKSEKR